VVASEVRSQVENGLTQVSEARQTIDLSIEAVQRARA